MSVDDFKIVCDKIKPYTSYVYLHVMGEPLLHPHFEDIMNVALQNGFKVNITTNGSLLENQMDVLLKYQPNQINISLHDLEENISDAKINFYMKNLFHIVKKISTICYINLRLWNNIDGTLSMFTKKCLNTVAESFNCELSTLNKADLEAGIHLSEKVYLKYADRFDWPNEESTPVVSSKTCYALKDHIAILSDGSIVPCCLDADAHLKLGNIFTDDIALIQKSERVVKMKEGFRNKIAVEEFCKRCGFR